MPTIIYQDEKIMKTKDLILDVIYKIKFIILCDMNVISRGQQDFFYQKKEETLWLNL